MCKYVLQYIRSLSGLKGEGFESLDANMLAKRRRICGSIDGELGNSMARKVEADDCGHPGNTRLADLGILFLYVCLQRYHVLLYLSA